MQPWQPQQHQPPAWTPPPLPGAIAPKSADEHDLAALSPFLPKVAAAIGAVGGLCAVLGSLQTWMTVDVRDDAACHVDVFDRAMRERHAPNWHYLHMTHDVLPALRKKGVTDDQIHTMLVDNPRRIFSASGGY